MAEKTKKQSKRARTSRNKGKKRFRFSRRNSFKATMGKDYLKGRGKFGKFFDQRAHNLANRNPVQVPATNTWSAVLIRFWQALMEELQNKARDHEELIKTVYPGWKNNTDVQEKLSELNSQKKSKGPIGRTAQRCKEAAKDQAKNFASKAKKTSKSKVKGIDPGQQRTQKMPNKTKDTPTR